MEKKKVELISPGDFVVERPSKVSLYNVRDHTFIIGLKEILPEDIIWRRDHPRVPSLICFEEDYSCDCPWGCIAKAAARCLWFFSRFSKLQQLLILFKRDEKHLLRQQYVRLDRLGNVTLNQNGVPKEKVPRIWTLIVPNDFYERATPYRLSRVNHNGLQLVLQTAQLCQIDVDTNFWLGAA